LNALKKHTKATCADRAVENKKKLFKGRREEATRAVEHRLALKRALKIEGRRKRAQDAVREIQVGTLLSKALICEFIALLFFFFYLLLFFFLFLIQPKRSV
jgi:hypothetical protein